MKANDTVSCWADLARIRPRYQRSVHLERDQSAPDWLEGYVITPLVRSVAARIAGGLTSTSRSWSLTGPYGTGKSAFALFLSHLLSVPEEKVTSVARQLLRDADEPLGQQMFGRGGVFSKNNGLCPVLATGERRPLENVLLRALDAAVQTFWSGRGMKPDIVRRVSAAARRAEAGKSIAPREVVDLFREVAEKVERSALRGNGLLVILDEAGKVLEYAAHSPTRGDIQLLQELAEAANRSGDHPIVLVVLLHQSFERYAQRLNVQQRNEWAKVQGRFEDVPFQEASDQVLQLIGAAIELDEVPARFRASADDAIKSIAKLTRLPGGLGADELAASLYRTLPLHPATALTLGPLFRSRICQNERSLFAFLSTSEPHGFQDFLRLPWTSELQPWYTLDRLYDYLTSTFGPRLYEHNGRSWAQIEDALHRLPEDAGELEARLIKIIGLLGALGEATGLVASDVVLEAALDMGARDSRERVQRALRKLKAASIIVFRKYRNAYQLWEGSDLDLDAAVRGALADLDHTTSPVDRLNNMAGLRPLVARRHLFETGTLRYFSVRFADETILAGPATIDEDGDGAIWAIVPQSEQAEDDVRQALAGKELWEKLQARERPLLVGLPSDCHRLRELALELSALERVQLHTPQLQDDAVARRELAGRMAEADRLLRLEIARILTGRGACGWYYRGRALAIQSARELASTLSDICAETYAKAPAVHNELVNRRNISSAAAAARRALMQAMVDHGHEERLGIEGFPPELSIYRSLLEAHGMHRQGKDGWRFSAPKAAKGTLAAVYEVIREQLARSESTRLGLAGLYDTLRRPPFGLKDGILPPVVLAVCLELESELALYEEGAFVPAINGPVIERMLRSPEKFEVQLFRISGARATLFQKLHAVFTRAQTGTKSALLPIVRELVRTVRSLPEYSRNTHSTSKTAQAVREALLRAKEPGPLVFRDLPAACGLRPFDAEKPASEQEVDDMVSRLKGALRELQTAFPRLLDEIELSVSGAFSLPADGVTGRAELVGRAQRLLPYVVETQLKGFLMRAAADGMARDEWLTSIATLLGGKPPDLWHDRDLDEMRLNLGIVVGRTQRLEALLASQGTSVAPNGATLLRLSITQPGELERERVILVREHDQEVLEIVCERVRRAVDAEVAGLPQDAILAGLALVARELIAKLAVPLTKRPN